MSITEITCTIFGEIETTNKEQGLFYFIVSLVLKLLN